MKKFFFFAIAALLISCGSKASTDTETTNEVTPGSSEMTANPTEEPSLRECTSFSTQFRKDENGQVDALIVTCTIDVEKQELTCEFPWAKDEDLLGEAGEISEDDINFDGTPDLMVCLGNFAIGFEPDYLYSTFVWNASVGRFERIKELDEAFNLRIDKENKNIISEYKTAAGDHVTETYKWKDGKIVLTNTESFNPDEEEEE